MKITTVIVLLFIVVCTTAGTNVATETGASPGQTTDDCVPLQAVLMLVKSQDSRLQQQAARLDLLQGMLTSLHAPVNTDQARTPIHHQVKVITEVLDAKLTAAMDNLTSVMSRTGRYDNKFDTGDISKVSEAEVKVISDLLDVKLSSVLGNLTAVMTREDSSTTDGYHNNMHRSSKDSRGTGSTYIRWGRSQCPQGASTLYTGYAAGGAYKHTGTGANRLCVTSQPVYTNTAILGGHGSLYGAQYYVQGHTQNTDVLCSLCHTALSATFMIPGTNRCPNGTTEQYHGHLSSGNHGSKAASEYLCLDSNPEDRHGSTANLDSAWFDHTTTVCGSLPCPPYVAGKAVTCVVCSK